MNYKEEIVEILQPIIDLNIGLIEIPSNPQNGDFAVPCFTLSKTLNKSPTQIADDLSKQIKLTKYFSKVINKGPYLNFFVNKAILINENLTEIYYNAQKYGNSDIGINKCIIVDFSSPNIAKPFGIAHIRSTVIGNSICKIYDALGYTVIRVNHLGDWGTQFGKLMVAYKEWGDENKLSKDGINYLVKIYIEFGERAKEDPSLIERARGWFKKLEDGNPEAKKLWTNFRELSIIEFEKYYEELEIKFDYYHGEAFYNDQLSNVIELVKKKIPTEISQGALIVNLEEKNIEIPLILQKSDGATTYHTRDIAAALYRINQFNPVKIIYVVGTTQKLHFEQLFTVLEMLGEDPDKFVHVNFGNMTYKGEMMATRRGNFIPLSEVLNTAVKMVKNHIEEKNPVLKTKEEVAKEVGIGAVIFGDLFYDRVIDIDFSWEKAVNFKGETAPYLQYTHARVCSIKRKANVDIRPDVNFDLLKEYIEFELVKLLGYFPEKVLNAANYFKPHIIANYLIDLAQTFNKFYDKCMIIKEEEPLRDARLLLAECTRIILENGLRLLGIRAPHEM